MTYQEKPRTTPITSLKKLAQRSNGSIGRAPSVKTGMKAVQRCSGASPLKPTWKAAGKAFGVRWQVLAAITQIESGFGCNMGPSSAGAIGWTQFMPATWKQWGMDANGDHKASPYHSADAIFSTARYLRANGAPGNYRRAIFAYNHADWYVNQVLGLSRGFSKAVDPNGALPQQPLGTFHTAQRVTAELPPTTEYDLDAGDPMAEPLPAPTHLAPRGAADAD
jgi:soluble lytic murein transglycosylase-like protein